MPESVGASVLEARRLDGRRPVIAPPLVEVEKAAPEPQERAEGCPAVAGPQPGSQRLSGARERSSGIRSASRTASPGRP
jgi:hypothetical protein